MKRLASRLLIVSLLIVAVGAYSACSNSTSSAASGSGGQASGGIRQAGGQVTSGSASGGAAGHTEISASGGASGASGSGGTSNATDASPSDACAPYNPTGDFSQQCLSCANGDACLLCGCNQCGAQAKTCFETPGCSDILKCGKDTGCTAETCYCGSTALVACGLNPASANGPCKDVILNAPGGHPPTGTDPYGGPAGQAAYAVAQCLTGTGPCATACGK